MVKRDNNFPIPDFEGVFKKLLQDLPRYVEVTAKNFFIDSFHKQGFTNENFEAWERRNQPDYRAGGAILTATGALRNSIHTIEANTNNVTIGTYAAYAKIHNEGGIITLPVTKKMKKYFWYMYKTTQNEKWKWMALTKKQTLKLKFPKRQFIGDSVVLMNNIEQWFFKEIEKRIKQSI